MRYTIRSTRGRLHLAEQSGIYWLAECGSILVHITEQRPAVSSSTFVTMDDTVCAYCRAIGRAVLHTETLAREATADAERYWQTRRPRTGGAHATP